MVDAGGLSVEGVSAFPRSGAHRYTQVLEARHFGRDAEIQRPRMANCGTQQMPLYPQTGNYGLASHLNQALAQPTGYRPWPGYRHPCRYDGVFQLVATCV